MTTVPCPKCGKANEPNQLVCATCGTLLFNPSTTTVHMRINPALLRLRHTRQLESESSVKLPEHTIHLQIRGMSERLSFEEGTEIVLGRTDLGASSMQRLDLSLYGAHERGVSRDHAVLRYSNNELTLTDLNSSNGTSVNLKKLEPNKPQVLKSGDAFTLGTLTIVVHFESGSEAVPSADAPRFDETLPMTKHTEPLATPAQARNSAANTETKDDKNPIESSPIRNDAQKQSTTDEAKSVKAN